MQRLIVYIDGFNLYHGLHDHSRRRHLWLDVVKLAQSLRPRSQLVAVRYFTAPVLDEPAALSRQTTYLDALRSQHPTVLTVTEGRYQSKEIICRSCGDVRVRYEEKETDVNIAVSLVADTARQLADAALVISADSDLIPAIRTARELDPALFIAAAFPPARFSAHIKSLMPASLQIGNGKISQAQFPQAVTDPVTGRVFTRPTKWQ